MKPAWQMSRAAYQAALGVHRPWICEVSPAQMGAMSKRVKAAYDQKRAAEWAASAKVGADYQEACVAAYDAGEIGEKERAAPGAACWLDNPDLDTDAKSAILGELVARRKAAGEAADRAAREAAEISSADDVAVGDVVYWVVGGCYSRVVKKNRKTVRIAARYGEMVVAWGQVSWMSPSDAVEAAAAGLRPGRGCVAELRNVRAGHERFCALNLGHDGACHDDKF